MDAALDTISAGLATVTMSLPTIVYEWRLPTGIMLVSVDVLMLSGSCKKDLVSAVISEDGLSVTIKVRIPRIFFAEARVAAANQAEPMSIRGIRQSAFNGASTTYRESFPDPQEPCMEMTIQLPQAVDPRWRPESKPTIQSYEHDYRSERATANTYKMLHLEMVARKKPKENRAKARQADTVIRSPFGDEGFDDEDYDSDNDAERGAQDNTEFYRGFGQQGGGSSDGGLFGVSVDDGPSDQPGSAKFGTQMTSDFTRSETV